MSTVDDGGSINPPLPRNTRTASSYPPTLEFNHDSSCKGLGMDANTAMEEV